MVRYDMFLFRFSVRSTRFLLILCGLVSVFLLTVFSCSKSNGAGQATSTTSPAVENDDGAKETTTIAPTTTVPRIGPVKSGDIPELLRFTMRNTSADNAIVAEDFGLGSVLNLKPSDAIKAKGAIELIRNWVQAFKEGKSLQSYCTKEAARLSDINFGPYRKELSTLVSIRFLSQYRLSDTIADFEIVLSTQTARAELSFYLISDEIKGNWLISDVQGDLATLSQSVESQYTDYAPQDAERQLIREGHQIQWQ